MTSSKAAKLDSEQGKKNRGAKRRTRTRGKLLVAALKLMAARGLEGVTINEITEEADVGLGSFYNHFDSKEAIYNALYDSVFEDIGNIIDKRISEYTDPAEMISFAIRLAMEHARNNPDWARFFVREGFSERALVRGLSVRLIRDLDAGLQSGRFIAGDTLFQLLTIGGLALASMSAQIEFSDPHSPHSLLAKTRDISTHHLDQRLAANVLINLGIEPAEATEISRLPLPQSISEDLEDTP